MDDVTILVGSSSDHEKPVNGAEKSALACARSQLVISTCRSDDTHPRREKSHAHSAASLG